VKWGVGRTDIQYPAQPNGWNEAAIPEALYPQTKGETPPGPDEVFSGFPEEDGEGTTHYAGYGTRKDEHALKGFTGGIYCWKNTKFDDENEANEGKSIKSDEKERSPEGSRFRDRMHSQEGRAHHLFL
jgi:hypothetical protein